jgi:hypothetical protein
VQHVEIHLLGHGIGRARRRDFQGIDRAGEDFGGRIGQDRTVNPKLTLLDQRFQARARQGVDLAGQPAVEAFAGGFGIGGQFRSWADRPPGDAGMQRAAECCSASSTCHGFVGKASRPLHRQAHRIAAEGAA